MDVDTLLLWYWELSSSLSTGCFLFFLIEREVRVVSKSKSRRLEKNGGMLEMGTMRMERVME